MELRHLRYFVTVAELLNFTKAATRLRVAQPALSRQVRDLEDELGVQLLERGPRSVRLTEAGATFLSEAKAVLRRAEEATQAVKAVARGERGEIHVGYAPTPTVELLPCALHTFQNIAPEVRMTLHDLSSEEMLRGLGDGKLHVCLMVQSSPAAMRGLKFEVLREYETCVALRPSHPLARAKQVRLEQIVTEPLVAYARADYPEYHTMLEELFRACGRKPRVVEEHDSAPGLIAAVEIGRGLAIVPSCMAMLTGNRLKLRPLLPQPAPLQVGVAYDPKRISVAAEKFLSATRVAPAPSRRR
ncbi:MAG: LysR family transcriptional regulator [Verrucomicrobia bacterium]|nr:MAG: LysR family transcriptional regulator [Verrucomicrobiota bacterium]